ncbi:hypothetical protein LSCM1_04139 [Leishmania martiniquensis]|uniref:Uncharacterized protein n=1 Tax=Leishmania martiniquensis TaxID=1580590 RepID=A0A836KHR6_9TRYP|nr:hypothetical protein LSCM1_04139 [Leishmania martiniquensis]
MVARTLSRFYAQWPAALVAVNASSPASDAWIPNWNAFFDGLQLQEESRRGETDASSYTRFGAVPAPLLRSIAQHWVDKALLAVTSARLAEVCRPAHATASRGVCEAAEPPLASASSPVMPSKELELLLATWSAHMLLSVLHTLQEAPAAAPSHMIRSHACAAPNTVSAALAECLKKDVVPVLRYLAEFAAPPVSALVSQPHHRLHTSTRALRHALALLLFSFVATWREAASPNVQSPSREKTLSREERALALELCRCIAACSGSDAEAERTLGGEHHGDAGAQAHSCYACGEAMGLCASPFESVTEAQLALVQAALTGMLTPDDGSAASTNAHTRDSEAGDGPLWRAFEAWITGAGAAASSSPFAGITETPTKGAEAVDVLQRVNSQLNQIARSSAATATSAQP